MQRPHVGNTCPLYTASHGVGRCLGGLPYHGGHTGLPVSMDCFHGDRGRVTLFYVWPGEGVGHDWLKAMETLISLICGRNNLVTNVA